jgi:peptidoglycan-N-acetylglucosamine deacetylase
LWRVYWNYVEHGPEYALQTLIQVVVYYAAFLAVDWLAAVVALFMEKGEERPLAWLVLLQRFAYRQVMYWVVVQAVVAALKGRARGWGKLVRKGTVTVGAG